MENEPELIRDQMQETRTALTEKLDTLQQKVADTVESITAPVAETVQTVKEAVTDTVESVKDTVSDTVESVKETFDLSLQVQRHPWGMMLGSLATGFALGRLLPSPFATVRSHRRGSDHLAAGMSEAGRGHNGFHAAMERTPPVEEPPPPKPKESSLFSGLADAFHDELDKLKGLGISVAAGVLRDLLTQSMHGELGGRVREWMDDLTRKFGGKPLSEPVVAPGPGDDAPSKGRETEGTEEGDSKRSTTRKGKTSHEVTPRW